jgi:hypothetical protein
MSGSNVEATYSALLRELRFPQVVIDAHEGRIAFPDCSLTAPFSPSYVASKAPGSFPVSLTVT